MLARLFGWRAPLTQKVIQMLVEKEHLVVGVAMPGQPGEWYAVPELVENR